MTTLRQLESGEASQRLLAAKEQRTPCILTYGFTGSWSSMDTRIISVSGTRLCLEMLSTPSPHATGQLASGDEVGVCFKYKDCKLIFSAAIIGVESLHLPDGKEIKVLSLNVPPKVQQIQRRAYVRANVPPNCIVRASFWLGGSQSEPEGITPDRPIWCGRVTDISIGGCLLEAEGCVARTIEVGETAGVRLAFGDKVFETILVDAQLRHVRPSGQYVMMGFQFMGLERTTQGRAVIDLIKSKVHEYLRAAKRAAVARQRRDVGA